MSELECSICHDDFDADEIEDNGGICDGCMADFDDDGDE